MLRPTWFALAQHLYPRRGTRAPKEHPRIIGILPGVAQVQVSAGERSLPAACLLDLRQRFLR